MSQTILKEMVEHVMNRTYDLNVEEEEVYEETNDERDNSANIAIELQRYFINMYLLLNHYLRVSNVYI
jgi:hypothetical protein